MIRKFKRLFGKKPKQGMTQRQYDSLEYDEVDPEYQDQMNVALNSLIKRMSKDDIYKILEHNYLKEQLQESFTGIRDFKK